METLEDMLWARVASVFSAMTDEKQGQAWDENGLIALALQVWEMAADSTDSVMLGIGSAALEDALSEASSEAQDSIKREERSENGRLEWRAQSPQIRTAPEILQIDPEWLSKWHTEPSIGQESVWARFDSSILRKKTMKEEVQEVRYCLCCDRGPLDRYKKDSEKEWAKWKDGIETQEEDLEEDEDEDKDKDEEEEEDVGQWKHFEGQDMGSEDQA